MSKVLQIAKFAIAVRKKKCSTPSVAQLFLWSCGDNPVVLLAKTESKKRYGQANRETSGTDCRESARHGWQDDAAVDRRSEGTSGFSLRAQPTAGIGAVSGTRAGESLPSPRHDRGARCDRRKRSYRRADPACLRRLRRLSLARLEKQGDE